MSKSSLPNKQTPPIGGEPTFNPYAPPQGKPDAAAPGGGQAVTRLSDLSAQQWKSGAAAWLGWLFDGLDIHLYTLVATPFVASLVPALFTWSAARHLPTTSSVPFK